MTSLPEVELLFEHIDCDFTRPKPLPSSIVTKVRQAVFNGLVNFMFTSNSMKFEICQPSTLCSRNNNNVIKYLRVRQTQHYGETGYPKRGFTTRMTFNWQTGECNIVDFRYRASLSHGAHFSLKEKQQWRWYYELTHVGDGSVGKTEFMKRTNEFVRGIHHGSAGNLIEPLAKLVFAYLFPTSIRQLVEK